jgi:hypothetical protein
MSHRKPIMFEHVLSTMQRQTLALTSAIGNRNFLHAWCECRELQRTLTCAAACLNAIQALPDWDNAAHRMSIVRSLAISIMKLAPMPSKNALQQARSSNWKSDRSQWNHEEQQWLAARLPESTTPLPRMHPEISCVLESRTA